MNSPLGIMLVVLYVACEIIANTTAGRPVSLFGLEAPGGVFIYALTFTLIDLINELFGKVRARQIVFSAFAANIVYALYTALVLRLPSPSFFTEMDSFAAVLGAAPRIVGASLAAYLVSSLIDVEIFAAWKGRTHRHKWARVLLSNGVSTGVDSAIFVILAFWGSLPLLPLIVGQYVMKMAVTVVSIPLIYLARGAVSPSPSRPGV